MNKTIKKYLVVGCLALLFGATSCVGDLDLMPTDPNKKTELVNGGEYWSFFAQLYGGLVVSSPDGGSDIVVDDGGAGVYTRQLWNLQELCSDEVIIGRNWNDAGITELDFSTWSSSNHWLYECYSRFTFQINMCNEFLRSIDKAAGVTDPISAEDIAKMKNEARVIRALSYYHLIDLFGKGPLTTEANKPGATPPTASRQELYDFVVKDLLEVVDLITPQSQQIYGRVSREGAYMLLAKLYLNAGVYTGTKDYANCVKYCDKILESNLHLADVYKYLFCGSNDKYVRTGEILWGIPQDTNNTQTYGGTTYLALGAYNSAVEISTYGFLGTGWNGPRVRPELVDAFEPGDLRYLLYAGKFKKDVSDLGEWGEEGSGYMCIKYTGTEESDYYNEQGLMKINTFNNADFPLFRLSDVYLMIAECDLNGAKSDKISGQDAMDTVRQRAGVGPITLNADNLLAERLRELYWEGHRRSDLIRFGKFTGSSYVWSWKGGVLAGASIVPTRALYPIPSKFVSTIGQNPGY